MMRVCGADTDGRVSRLLAAVVVSMCACGNAKTAGTTKAPESAPPTGESRELMPPQEDGSIDCTACTSECSGQPGVCCNLQLSGPCSGSKTEVGECIIVRHCDPMCCAPAANGAPIPGGSRWTEAEYRSRVASLAKFGRRRIGPVGGGPVMPSADVIYARETVKRASRGQLEEMLKSDNAAIRAHVAREIIRFRPDDLALIRLVANDEAPIAVGSMDDIPPIEDSHLTIAELVRRELAYTGHKLP